MKHFILAGSLFFSIHAQAFDIPEISDLKQIERRDPIVFVPFDMIDPITGKLVTASTMIELPGDLANEWGSKRVTAREYYRELNELEKFWNELGYSLRRPEDIQYLSSLSQDIDQLVKQAKSIDEAIKEFDEKIMSVPQEIATTKKDFEQRLRNKAEEEFTELYNKAMQSLTPEAEIFENLRENPNLIQKPNKNLSNFIYKEWATETGSEDSFYLKGLASVNVSGNFKELEGLADARIDVTIMKELKKNLFYLFLKANALDSGKVSGETGVEVLGQVIDQLSKKKSGNFLSWRFSKDESDSSPWQLQVREGKEFAFSIGPVPVVAEVGFAGRVYIDQGFNVSTNNVSVSVIPGAESYAYGNMSAGVPVAKAGIEQDLILLNSELDIAGGLELSVPQDSGKPMLSANVTGRNTSTALNGRMKFVAQAKLPVVGEQRYEKLLWDYDGLHWDGVIFDFSKTANDQGYQLSGSPETVDLDEVQVDNVSYSLFTDIDHYTKSDESRELGRRVSKLISDQRSLVDGLNEMIQSMRN